MTEKQKEEEAQLAEFAIQIKSLDNILIIEGVEDQRVAFKGCYSYDLIIQRNNYWSNFENIDQIRQVLIDCLNSGQLQGTFEDELLILTVINDSIEEMGIEFELFPVKEQLSQNKSQSQKGLFQESSQVKSSSFVSNMQQNQQSDQQILMAMSSQCSQLLQNKELVQQQSIQLNEIKKVNKELKEELQACINNQEELKIQIQENEQAKQKGKEELGRMKNTQFKLGLELQKMKNDILDLKKENERIQLRLVKRKKAVQLLSQKKEDQIKFFEAQLKHVQQIFEQHKQSQDNASQKSQQSDVLAEPHRQRKFQPSIQEMISKQEQVQFLQNQLAHLNKLATTTTNKSIQQQFEFYQKQVNYFIQQLSLQQSISDYNKIQNESSIMTESDYVMIKERIMKSTNSLIQLRLLYKGTRDGFRAKEFHQKCDKKGPTLTVIKTSKNYKFGGFTTLNWKSCFLSKFKKGDQFAFLFSFTNVIMTCNDNEHVIYCAAQRGPCFGQDDLFISDNCDQNYDSFSHSCQSYGLKEGYQKYKYVENNQYYLTGDENFKVSEIEVYSVKMTF